MRSHAEASHVMRRIKEEAEARMEAMDNTNAEAMPPRRVSRAVS
jgi:hypothetical protein